MEFVQTIAAINAALDSSAVEQQLEKGDEAVKKKHKQVKAKLKYGEREWSKKWSKYEQQQVIMGERNSYSKTDTDATFMRMKDDVMRNGQLKAGYNLQISTENQYILNYGLYANPSDTLTYIPHLTEFAQLYGQYPDETVTDSGYGSEQNYEFLEQKGIQAYVKYNYFHRELQIESKLKKGKTNTKLVAKQAFHPTYLHYNEQEDYYVCPMGQRMEKVRESTTKNKSGYQQHITTYRAKRCENCPLRGVCFKSKNKQARRTIRINHRMNRYRKAAKERLTSEQGKAHRSQRPVDVEAVFGNIKQNKKFTRYHLRGKSKVSIETGLIAIAHNLKKWAKQRQLKSCFLTSFLLYSLWE